MEAVLELPKLKYGQPGPSIQEFYDDGHFIRVLLGGRGSAKSTAVATDIIGHLWQNAGGKAIVARETEVSQSDSSIDTFWQVFASFETPLYQTGGLGLFKAWNDGRTFRVPSMLAVKRMQEECKDKDKPAVTKWIDEVGDRLCGYIEFRGLPDADKGKFRGMECSYLALIEADQIAKKQFDLSLACLRWKGSDPEMCDEMGFIKDRCVVLDSNPPGTKHWIAQMEESEAKKEDSVMRFWHIDTRENEHNLPPNYIRDTILLPYSENPAMIQRMLHGQYADAYDGTPVFWAFRSAVHEGQNMDWPQGAYLVRGYDWGTNNSVVWCAHWIEGGEEYLHAMHEQYLESSDTDQQMRGCIQQTDSEFPFWNDRSVCSGVLDYCDPAGQNSAFTRKINVNGKQVDESALNIARTFGVYPGFKTTARGLQETIATVNRMLTKRDSKGRPIFRIDTVNCPQLTKAMRGGYRYPSVGETGYGNDVPLKGPACDNLDHMADNIRYIVCNVMKLLTEAAKPKPHIPWNKPRRNINAAR